VSICLPKLLAYSDAQIPSILSCTFPSTKVGSVERATQEMYILSGEEIIEKEITYTPGLYKIYDEILVNAADNKQRDPNMDKLDIEIDAEKNTISVRNNGKGIPIEFHKDEQCYVPTLVFGEFFQVLNCN
jgi:DNA topoisomerase-2